MALLGWGSEDPRQRHSPCAGADAVVYERAWEYSRGQLTVLVAARIRYRDRVFNREREFCQYMNPRTNEWRPCPFLND